MPGTTSCRPLMNEAQDDDFLVVVDCHIWMLKEGPRSVLAPRLRASDIRIGRNYQWHLPSVLATLRSDKGRDAGQCRKGKHLHDESRTGVWHRAVAPHAYLPFLLDDTAPEERASLGVWAEAVSNVYPPGCLRRPDQQRHELEIMQWRNWVSWFCSDLVLCSRRP